MNWLLPWNAGPETDNWGEEGIKELCGTLAAPPVHG